jgi:hypothetical protein
LKIEIYFEIRNPGLFPANFVHAMAVLCREESRQTLSTLWPFSGGIFPGILSSPVWAAPERPRRDLWLSAPYGTPGGQTNTGREEMRNERGREGHTGGLRVTRKEEMGLGGKDIRRGEEKMTGIIVAA